MTKPNRRKFLFGVVAASLILAACTPTPAPPATEAPKPTDAPAPATEAPKPTEPPASEAQTFVTWYQYDQANEDPKSDERVGNEYLRKTIPLFNEQFKGKWNWVNQPKAFDKMLTELITAVQSGGEIPDLMQSGDGELATLLKNGAVEDLTDWAQAQAWFKDLDPNAVNTCKGPDGKLYCIPVSQGPQVVFVWKDRFPNGFPKTPEEFMQQAEELKKQNLYAITFFGSTDFDGLGFERFIWTTVSSFGGSIDDGKGKMVLTSPETVKAIEFVREIVVKGYAPEIVFAGKFQEEEAFKDASAGSFPTGLFGYRYVNPLSAPSGKKYEKKNEQDMLDAIEAGDVIVTPFFAPAGQKPGCGIGVSTFIIPKGAKNQEGAKEYINWVMGKEQNAAWVLAPGGGFPVLKATQSEPTFQTAFYKQAALAAAASACRPWHGSLERREEAIKLVMTAVYKAIKEDQKSPVADILKVAEEEYNKNN